MSPDVPASAAADAAAPKLSVCIATFNRAAFIAETLRSILDQLGPADELVIVDGASKDQTESVVAPFLQDCRVRYFRETTNSGVDRDFDKAVGYARGEYCWLMTDDDVLLPGAVAAVRAALAHDDPVVVLNTRVLDPELRTCLVPRQMPLEQDAVLDPRREAPALVECLRQMTFIGAVVVRRAFWQARQREPYYDSLFIHVGVVFQDPMPARIRLVAAPQVAVRYGNAMWTPRSFEIWMFKWPQLVWSFPALPAATRQAVAAREPWRQTSRLLMNRATGAYSMAEFRRFIAAQPRDWGVRRAWFVALLPARLLNLLGTLAFMLFKPGNRVRIHDLLSSRHSSALSRLAGRLLAART